MKKTVNINVAGYPFVINEDAFTLLDEYLKTIEHAFRNVDGSTELINDIESRVAELLIGCTENGSTIITVEDVEYVISRIGKPEEMVEEDSFTIDSENPDGTSQTINMDVESERVTPPPYIPPLPKPKKQLYRDPQNAMIGGVCSGLAWYIGWDVTWVRLIMVALLIASVTTVGIVYLILWIVVPEARTPLQRMQMMGEQPTMENIAKTVTDNFREDQGEPVKTQPTTAPASASTLATIFSVIAKILIVIGLIIAIPIFVAMITGLLGCVFFMIMWGATKIFGAGMPFEDTTLVDPYVSKIVFWGVMCGIGWVITLGVPLFSLIRKGLNKKPLKPNTRNSLNFIWVIGFILAALSTGMVINAAFNQERYEDEWHEQRKQQRIEQELNNQIEQELNQEIKEQVGETIEEAMESAREALDSAQEAMESAKEANESVDEAQKTLGKANQALNEMKEDVKSLTTKASESLKPLTGDSVTNGVPIDKTRAI